MEKVIYTYVSRAKYEGEFKNSKCYGNGIYTYPNGNRYEGEFLNGKEHRKYI